MTNETLIVKFFENSLSKKEIIEFDRLLKSDPDFKADVEFRKELQDAITNQDRNTIKQELQHFDSSSKNDTKFKLLRIAASVVILLGISSFWFFGNSTMDSEQLFAQYFEPSRNLVQPIVRGETPKDLKSKAFTAYETGNYENALDYFDQLLAQHDDQTIAFYKANALLKLNKTEDAIAIFNKNLKTSDSLDAKNKWYLALAFLKNNDTEKAKQQLQELTDSESNFKANKVEELLKALD